MASSTYRHGTLSLYAALNTRTGEILGQTVPRHTSQAFVEFLDDISSSQPRRRDIHVIVDNLSAHKTKTVAAFLEAHPRVHLHFTPTYSSWLNQVELWFGKIERDLLARGIFTSIPDLARKIRRYITKYNEHPKPIRWTYNDSSHRITTVSAVTGRDDADTPAMQDRIRTAYNVRSRVVHGDATPPYSVLIDSVAFLRKCARRSLVAILRLKGNQERMLAGVEDASVRGQNRLLVPE